MGLAWNATGSKLYFSSSDGRIKEVEIRTDPSLIVGTPHDAIPREKSDVSFRSSLSVSPDEERFLIVRREADPDAPVPQLVVVENWAAEFEGNN